MASIADRIQAYSNQKKNRAIALAAELARRKIETLRLYEPLPFQEKFHACKAYEAILQKGNRAGGPAPLSEPVLTPRGWVPIGKIEIGDKVLDHHGLPVAVKDIQRPGVKPVYRVVMSNGAFTTCCGDHLWRLCWPHDRALVTTEVIKEWIDSRQPGDLVLPHACVDGNPHAFNLHIEGVVPVGEEDCRCLVLDSDDGLYVTKDFIVTHNSLAGFVEVARAVTGQDPYEKYPKENGTAICLGYGEKHIGRVIHRYLFEPGAFQIVRDPVNGKWRVWKPWLEPELEALAIPAPPLIPKRFIQRHVREDGSATSQDGIVWEKRGDRVFSQVRFTNGWTLYAANSAGDPSQYQGFNVNLYHIDEDLATGGWYEEAVGRTCAVGGLIRWTAMPHENTPDISRMIERAEEQEGQEEPTTVAIRASQDDNPYLDKEGVKRAEAVWSTMGEDAVRKRKYGELTTSSILMYPNFSPSLHDALEDDGVTSPVQKALQATNGIPPYDWARFMWVDPGHTIAATLFIAIPPPNIGEQPVVYDEIYIHRCTPDIWADKVQEKVGRMPFQAFGMDAHGGRLTSLTDGVDPRTAYSRALKERDIYSVDTMFSFRDGCDNIEFREQKLREYIAVGPDGFPGLYIVTKNCPNLCREMRYFKKKRVKVANEWIITDKGDRRANTHLVECLEYFAASNASYVKPPSYRRGVSYASQRISERKMRRAARNARYSEVEKLMGGRKTISLGPGG